jgi:hypothetical protein
MRWLTVWLNAAASARRPSPRRRLIESARVKNFVDERTVERLLRLASRVWPT